VSVPTHRPTEADERLCNELANGHGLIVTVRQLQQWRRLGIIPAPRVKHLGRGKGTRSIYPPGAADRVAEVAALVRQTGTLHTVVLGLFGTGRLPTERAVRAAYSWTLDQWEQRRNVLAAKRDNDAKAWSQEVRRVASGLRRDLAEPTEEWTQQARGVARAERATRDDVTGTKNNTSSKDIRGRDLGGFLDAMLDPGEGDATPMLGPFLGPTLVRHIDDDGGLPTFAQQRTALDAVTIEDLVRLRDAARAGLREAIAAVVPRPVVARFDAHYDDPLIGGIEIALGLPVAVVTIARIAGIEITDDVTLDLGPPPTVTDAPRQAKRSANTPRARRRTA
jgi:hypothetical protein